MVEPFNVYPGITSGFSEKFCLLQYNSVIKRYCNTNSAHFVFLRE